ncbi:Hpt domain-containing protein [Anaerotignum propionicum]|uniref:Hpt domain-containing protein n=1 Tax=Anaerotignum propionicum TaxID=28446 RepID=UPI00289CBE01|nr:Hpt domain-containing protein [Anaerotignum propionicum]
MEKLEKAKLTVAGVNLHSGMERFMNNEGLYETFLLKFPRDLNMERLRQALAEEEASLAFRVAHTLLGIAANLSMESLYEVLRPATEALREGNIALAKKHMPRVEEAYLLIIEALK